MGRYSDEGAWIVHVFITNVIAIGQTLIIAKQTISSNIKSVTLKNLIEADPITRRPIITAQKILTSFEISFFPFQKASHSFPSSPRKRTIQIIIKMWFKIHLHRILLTFRINKIINTQIEGFININPYINSKDIKIYCYEQKMCDEIAEKLDDLITSVQVI